MTNNTPMVFRRDQIEKFIELVREAITFTDINGDDCCEENIDIILQEVDSREVDLSDAYVSIHMYIINTLCKDPENTFYMRMSDALLPAYDYVKDIETKMYGKPKYVVSIENNNAKAWRTEQASQTVITSINLPVDVREEVAKYNFTTVSETSPETDLEDDKLTAIRMKFYDELKGDEDDNSKEELEWLERFKVEKYYNFIDQAIHQTNFYEQTSLNYVNSLIRYCVLGNLLGDNEVGRTEEIIAYESNCVFEEEPQDITQFIYVARNPALRALFTCFELSSTRRKEFHEFIESKIETIEEIYPPAEGISSEDFIYFSCIKAFAFMYGKLPMVKSGKDNIFLKLVMEFSDEEIRKHFYACFTELSDYYNERKFSHSATVCEQMKEYLANLQGTETQTEEDDVEQVDESKQTIATHNESLIIIN